MKKIFLFLTALVSLVSICFSQVNDFTVTLLDGTEFNLYSHLNNGTYIAMTFLFDG